MGADFRLVLLGMQRVGKFRFRLNKKSIFTTEIAEKAENGNFIEFISALFVISVVKNPGSGF